MPNYNMACYYLDNVNLVESSAESKEYARKAKEYAAKVLYKDMSKSLYHAFGAENEAELRIASEKTLHELIDAANRTIRNLQRDYKRQNMLTQSESILEFSKAFASAAEKLKMSAN